MTFSAQILRSALDILFTLLGAALVLRAWIYAVRLHPFNPIAQVILRYTGWIVGPISRLIRSHGRVDWASLAAAYLCALLFILLSELLSIGALPSVNALLPVLAIALVTLLRWFMSLVTWLTILQAVLSWVNPLSPIMTVLQVLTAPLLNPIRRILPNMGAIDFSPLVLLLLAQIVQMALTRFIYGLF